MRCADIVLVYLSFQSTCFKIETPMALHWFYSGSLITLNSPCTLALLVDTAVCTVTFCSLVQVLHVWEKICRTYILPQVQAYLYSVYFQHLMSVWHSCFSNSCLTIKYFLMGVVSSRKKLSLSTGQEGVKHGLMNHGLWPTRSPYVIPISYLHENHHHKKRNRYK